MNENTSTRKLQAIGNSFSVTMPRSWVRKYDLNSGDELTVKEQLDGSLTIMPISSSETEVSDEVLITFYPQVGSEIQEKCLSGVERIIVTSQNPIEKAELKRIRYFLKRCPTARIISEKPCEIIVQNLGVRGLPSREIMHGLFSMCVELFSSVKNRDDKDEIEYKFNQVRELYLLLIQYIRTYQTSGFLHPKDYQDFSHKKASDYRIICNYIRAISYKLTSLDYIDDGAEYYEEIEKYFDETFDAFLRNSRTTETHHKKAQILYFDLLWKRGAVLKDNLEGNVKFMIKDLLDIYYTINDILSVINILD